MEQILKELIAEIKYELFHYPETTSKQELKYIVKRVLKPKNTPKKDLFFWPHAMLAQALEATENIEILEKYYDAWIDRGMSIVNIDNIMNGYSLLYVYEKTKKDKYKQAADKLYTWIYEYEKQMGNLIPYRKRCPNHIYVDGVGMVAPFLCRYGSIFKNQEAICLGLKQIREFLEHGMDERTGLPYHGYDSETKVKYGIIGWGRAVGWLMLALADCIEYISDEKERIEFMNIFHKMVKAVLIYLRTDGSFSWQLLAVDGPTDTSAVAMIAYAIEKVSMGIEYGTELELMQQSLIESCINGKIYNCSGECEGFSQYPQIYGAYPWSLGPGVRYMAIKENINCGKKTNSKCNI